jgi:hypothetical protein
MSVSVEIAIELIKVVVHHLEPKARQFQFILYHARSDVFSSFLRHSNLK